MKKFVRNFTLIAISILLASCASHRKPEWMTAAEKTPNKFGHYDGYVEARWENDGRNMTLLRDLRYTDPDGQVWIAPAGSVVDGASIPRSLWSVMGGPFEGKYRNASVLHDVAYERHDRPPAECDRMFYNAMRCSGVSAVEAKTMYFSLLKFGRHWKFAIKKAKPVKIKGEIVAKAEPVDQNQITEARDWIRNADPSLEQIEQRAGSEAH